MEKSSTEEEQKRNEEGNCQMDEEMKMVLDMGSMFGRILMENLRYFENGGNFMFLTPSFQDNGGCSEKIAEDESKWHSSVTIE